MRRLVRNRIAVKLGLTIMGLVLLVLVPLSLVISSIISNFYFETLESNMRQLSARYATMIQNGGEMSVNMIGMMAELSQVDVMFFDQNGTLVAKTDLNQPPDFKGLASEEIIRLTNDRIIDRQISNAEGHLFLLVLSPLGNQTFEGALGILAPVQSARDTVDQVQAMLVLAGIGAIFLAMGITYIISRRLSQPLVEMEAAAKRMAKGDLEVKVKVLSDDEAGALARTINELGEELKRYRDTRSEFFANISHELRTPITYLEGYAQVLGDGLADTEEEKVRYLQIIRQEAQRLKRLVEDLFELSKMEEGKITIASEWIDLSEPVQHVLNRVGPRVAEKGLRLEVELDVGIPTIYADGNRIEQIYSNLLDNAIRYTAEGYIRVKLYRKDRHIVTEVSDTGVGIPKEELPFVFERFYRVEKSRSREYGGTGLGLAIVKKLVEIQNGTIEILSELHFGTTFIIKFPIDVEERAAE